MQRSLNRYKVEWCPGLVPLGVESTVTVEIEARSKKEKQSIKLSPRWEEAGETQESPVAPLTISDKEPELVGIIVEEE